MRFPVNLQKEHLCRNKEKLKLVKADGVNLGDINDKFPCTNKPISTNRKTKPIWQ